MAGLPMNDCRCGNARRNRAPHSISGDGHSIGFTGGAPIAFASQSGDWRSQEEQRQKQKQIPHVHPVGCLGAVFGMTPFFNWRRLAENEAVEEDGEDGESDFDIEPVAFAGKTEHRECDAGNRRGDQDEDPN